VRLRPAHQLQKRDLASADAIPTDIEGFPTDVIEAKIEPAHHSVPEGQLDVGLDPARYDPVVGGISIGPCRTINGNIYVGTLGMVVADTGTGEPRLLSNFHVMCVDDGWAVGQPLAQPGRPDGGACPADAVGAIAKATLDANIDGALSTLTGRRWSAGITDIGFVPATATAARGQRVRKRGRTTELTTGTVESTTASVTLDYGHGIGRRTLDNQITVRADVAPFMSGGDSGSVLVEAQAMAIGLVFAQGGNGQWGYANPFAAVMSELNVTLPQPFQRFLLQIGTPITEADGAGNFGAWLAGNYDGGAALIGIKVRGTGTGNVEVHVLSAASNYQQYVLQTGTPITEADGAGNYGAWAVGDVDGDGRADLIGIKVRNTDTGKVEAHVLSAASNYQQFVLQTGTPITEADGAGNYGAWPTGNYDGDGRADLIGIKVRNTGTGNVEVRVLDGQ
jgi:hypothetical protein